MPKTDPAGPALLIANPQSAVGIRAGWGIPRVNLHVVLHSELHVEERTQTFEQLRVGNRRAAMQVGNLQRLVSGDVQVSEQMAK